MVGKKNKGFIDFYSFIIICTFIIILLLALLGLRVDVNASEVQAETSQEEITDTQEDEAAAADADLLLFGYITEPEESHITLARIYNILLTFLYVYLINIGRQIIMRCMRKGQARRGLVE